jgi:hypothetical protein
MLLSDILVINYHNKSISECHTLRKLQTKWSTRQSGTSRAGKPIPTNENRISFYLALSSLTIAVPTIRPAGHVQHGANNTRRQQIPRGMRLRLVFVPIHRAECFHKYGSKTLQSVKLPFLLNKTGEIAQYANRSLVSELLIFPPLFRSLFSNSASYLKLRFRTTGMSGIPM